MRKIVRFALLGVMHLFVMSGSAQSLWQETSHNYNEYFSARNPVLVPSAYRLVDVNASMLQGLQSAAPKATNEWVPKGVPIELPLPDGKFFSTGLVEVDIWSDPAIPAMAGVKTYHLINPASGKLDGSITVRNNNSVDGIVFSAAGSVYIKPLEVSQTGAHMIYYGRNVSGEGQECGVKDEVPAAVVSNMMARTTAGDCRRRAFRLAISATGEYTNTFGGVNGALAHITATINTVNAIYLRDVNLTFNLVSGTTTIYTDPATDPFGTSSSAALDQNQTSTNSAIGFGNYDVGMVFSSAWGGGVAQLSSVCGPSKARGASGTLNNPAFSTTVAHEFGHMFGAGHTFASTNGSCSGNISLSSAWEPGGGSTILSYGANCPPTSFVNIRDEYFHAGSIMQMQNFILVGATCVTPVTTANQPPSMAHVPAALTYNVPANTPFMLTMTASDANGDALTYTWEQMNASSLNPNTAAPSASATSGPNFRTFPPNANPTRVFPNMQAVLANQTPTYEVLPAVARTMNFRGTVRDNSPLGGCTSEVDIVLNVRTSDGFKVVNPGWGTNVWSQPNGTTTASITWNVAGTNVAPISCDNVDILFSTDGGITYPIVLASATPNDGQHTIVIPAVNTNSGRVMVRGTNNVFFSVSEEPVFVTSPLPVTFLHFSVRRDGNTALLDWSTATETNSDKFIVERSANGSAFETQLGSVRAAGNSTTVQQYQFRDEAPLNRWNYYRLKQLDLDGKFSYSRTVSVFFDKGTAVTVYPNPVRSETTVEFVAERAGRVNIEVYDAKGALVFRNTFNAMAGFNRTTVQMGHLSRGIYTMKCYSEQNTLGVMKLVKE